MKKKYTAKFDFKLLLLLIFICQMAGVIGSIFTVSSIPTWYASLIKPSFNPPNWIFGPVWLTLYTMMGIAWYLIYKKGIEKTGNKTAFNLFAIHLIINALWSIIFFGFQQLFLGLIIIFILWAMILTLILLFWRISRISGVLLIPYLFWVSFATILNYFLWILNR